MIKEFQSIAKKMQEDFVLTREMPHQGIKGSAREQSIIEEFLKKYLPPKYSIGSGLVTDSEENYSKQQDIVVYDGFNSPVLQDFQSNKVFFAEQVFAVIEVKSNLNQTEVIDILKKGQSVSLLKRNGMYRLLAPTPDLGIPRIFIFGIAYESSMTLDQIRDYIQKKVDDDKAEWLLSALLILSDSNNRSGLITNLDPNEISTVKIYPAVDNPLASIKMKTSGEALFFFFLQLMQSLRIAEVTAVAPDFLAYAKSAGLGSIDMSVGIIGMQHTRSATAIEILKNAHLRPDQQVLEAFYFLLKQGEGFIPGGSYLDPHTRFTIGKDMFIEDPRPSKVWESLSRYMTGNLNDHDKLPLSQLLLMLRKVSSENTYLSIIELKSNDQE